MNIAAGVSTTKEEARDQIAGMLALARNAEVDDQVADAEALLTSLEERTERLPGSFSEYTDFLFMVARPVVNAGASIKELERITVGAVIVAKSMMLDHDLAARDVCMAIAGQYHPTDKLTGRVLGGLGYGGDVGRERFNSLSMETRLSVIKEAFAAAVPEDDVLDVPGAMKLLHVGRNTIYELCAQNRIPHRRVGGGRGTIRFSRAALLRWLEGER